ncbi:PREDICTED: uncharacterized protein LOC105362061 [Ceratosolen solmsi marchali]|uniref:Uncharacterized protein LOC105362061 n=1 Tax=Ceratosolen solmsi marchali TaxID=326594 RepID=A0AAJ6YGL3_9HYME|nr:PREDICTED: uncharacterized protein LOC105362061 [Ceratosolen solmsi marchali]
MAKDRKHRAIPGVLVIVLALISATAAESRRRGHHHQEVNHHHHEYNHHHNENDDNDNEQWQVYNLGLNANSDALMRMHSNARGNGNRMFRLYGFQNGVEELLLYGSELRAKILETLGTLVYDHYDEFSIDQLEALYRVYHDTLRRKYNIFEVAKKLKWQREVFNNSVICKTVLEKMCSCMKDSSNVCTNIKTPNYRRSNPRKISKNALKVSELFPKDLTLANLLKHIQKKKLKITPQLISGLLLNVPYNNFNNDVHRAEKILVSYLNSLSNNKYYNSLENLNKYRTIDDFLKSFLEQKAEQFPDQAKRAALFLAEHVQRDTNSISENIENFGITYENKTIDLKYLCELVIPNDLVDLDIIESRDYLESEMKRNHVVNRYLELDKYEHATPDQLLLEILRQMKRISRIISFPSNVVRALSAHADFWRKGRNIDNVADFINLFKAYDNLIDNPKFKRFFQLATTIQNKLRNEENIHLELTCTMPRPCLHRVLLKIIECDIIDDETKAEILEFMKLLDQNGRPLLVENPLNKITTSSGITKLLEFRTTRPTEITFVSSRQPSKNDGYLVHGELKPKPKKHNLSTNTEVNFDERELGTTPNSSGEENTTPKFFRHLSTNAISTEYPVAYNKFSTNIYSNIPENKEPSLDDQGDVDSSTDNMIFKLTPNSASTLNPKIKSKDKHPRGKPIGPNKILKLRPSGKSSTIIPNPDSSDSQEYSEEGTTVYPGNDIDGETIVTIATENPSEFSYETTTNLITTVTEPIDVSAEYTPINNDSRETIIDDNASNMSIEESTTNYSMEGTSTEASSTTIRLEKNAIFPVGPFEGDISTTTDSSICDDSDSCATESCEGDNCTEDKEVTTPNALSEECNDMSCEQSSETPCVGPNCSVTSQSAECQGSDEKCNAENCLDSSCSTPITTSEPTVAPTIVPTSEFTAVPTLLPITLHPIVSTVVSTVPTSTINPTTTTYAPTTTDALDITTESCGDSECSTSENCDKGSCSNEENCNSENCAESTEKCEGSDCSDSSSNCKDSNDEDCNNTTSKPENETVEHNLIGKSVICDSEDCSEKSSPSCQGPNCSSAELNDSSKPCHGTDCPTKTQDCDGKDCPDSSENDSDPTTPNTGDNVTKTHFDKTITEKPRSNLCISKDPHRKRKAEHLQKIRKLTALLADKPNRQGALLDSNEYPSNNLNAFRFPKYNGNISGRVKTLIQKLKTGKSFKKLQDSFKNTQANAYSNSMNIPENMNNQNRRKLVVKNSILSQQNSQHHREVTEKRIIQKQLKESSKNTRAIKINNRVEMRRKLPIKLRAYDPNMILQSKRNNPNKN